jgi:hypothetical protein
VDGPWTQFAPAAAPAVGPWTQYAPSSDSPQLPEWTTEGGAPIGDSGFEHVLTAAGRGVVAGFGSDNPLMTPALEAHLDQGGPLDRYVTQPILTAGGLGLRAVNALLGGAQAGVAQVGDEMGPGPVREKAPTGTGIDAKIGQYLRESGASLFNPSLASRDIAAMPEAFPTADTTGGTRLVAPVGDANAPARVTAREVQARDGVGIMEAWSRAHAENTAADRSAAIAKIGSATDIDGAIAAAADATSTPSTGTAGWTTGDTAVPARAPFVPEGIFAPTSAPPTSGFGDLFAPSPANADEGGRAIAQGRSAEGSAQDTTSPELPVSGANPYLTIPREPTRLIQFLKDQTTQFPGSIHETTIPGGIKDDAGDVAAIVGGPKGRPGLINNISGRDLDAATEHAWLNGYLPEFDTRPQITDLLDAIGDDHRGTPRYSIEDQDAADAYNHAVEHNSEIDNLANQTGIPTRGVTRAQFFDNLADHLSQQEHASVQAQVDAAHQESFDQAMAGADREGVDHGITEPRTLAELDDEYQQEDAARATLQGTANDARPGSVASNAGAGQAGGGSGGRFAGDAGRGGTQAGQPTPESVGAAASRDTTGAHLVVADTPAQRATALQKMVNQSAEDRLTPGGRDDAVYFPGVERPEAMRDFSPAAEGEMSTALQHKTLYNSDTNYHDQHDAQLKKNNDVMLNGATIKDAKGNPAWVEGLHDVFGDANTRDAAMNDARELMPGPVGLFNDERWTDAQPIVDKINEILAGPAGKRGAVESQLKSILPKLYDAKGNLESLPSMLKGVRDDITDRLYDKSPTVEGNAARTARTQLREVLNAVDAAIGDGLPGTKYQDYLANLSAALGKVSKLDYLQKFLTGSRKLTNQSGNLQLTKVQNMLEDINAHHADKTGGAKELSMAEINKIEAVRNELAAKKLLDDRASVRGSPTAQITNATGILGSGPLGAGVKGGAEVLLHAGLAAKTFGVGNAMLGGYRYIVKPAMAAAKMQKAAVELAETKTRLLDTTPRLGP